jgi:hypothetical protein
VQRSKKRDFATPRAQRSSLRVAGSGRRRPTDHSLSESFPDVTRAEVLKNLNKAKKVFNESTYYVLSETGNRAFGILFGNV